ncbi:hypothetical protein DAI22_08g070000 [Oryza sativa Japonica Group]|nr:hypothetical protein DAI22_08g069521 [Oryza sativa Japonica Group]KAF2918615.1 hypothetical protein DAI22_08g070000 [Oryza sativa Japonica Group]
MDLERSRRRKTSTTPVPMDGFQATDRRTCGFDGNGFCSPASSNHHSQKVGSSRK